MHTTPRLPDPMLAALTAKLITSPELRWRHHGIGLLQAYLVEGRPGAELALGLPDTETRIHVWHPSLRLAGMDDSGLMHDHRFDLESRVLLGAMHDTEIHLSQIFPTSAAMRAFLVRPSEGEERLLVWKIQNARAAKESGEGWVKLESEAVFRADRVSHVYSMGSSYTCKRGQFHRSDVEGLTVTLCTKRNQSSSPARLLAREGVTPRHAFADDPNRYHDASSPECRALIEEAALQLANIARVS